ncbi:DUF4344 domain-containing metallopeptidase [Laspinema sp. A4]|uniref:DUF4344 domain-containing metallopeptidase n=1 Tax=Laspinema sp. D2d TaxID=2953686 RepID=UPI0021BBA5DF|nr:DUF4344 domain-containing metallopeptidase [Laspinema sp. D2d]MCT7982192.1 DUF4344 domain-containing metallopeptidase [Laspinema sp. D2d]
MKILPDRLRRIYVTLMSFVVLTPVLISCTEIEIESSSTESEISATATPIGKARSGHIEGTTPASNTRIIIRQSAQTDELEDPGNILIFHTPVEDETYQEVHEIIQESEIFEEIAQTINELLILPNDIPVYFMECGEANAYYDPSTVEITMCYELIEGYKQIFTEEVETDEEYIAEVINAGLFTFFHELGHALVDQLELPITGREEDVVDEFAAIILLQAGEEGENAVLSGVWQFAVDAEEEAELEELTYWGEHSLNIQRYYNMACLVYGSNPEKYQFLVEDEDLPAERAEGCEYEYAQKSQSWEVLLSPYYQE